MCVWVNVGGFPRVPRTCGTCRGVFTSSRGTCRSKTHGAARAPHTPVQRVCGRGCVFVRGISSVGVLRKNSRGVFASFSIS